MASGVYFRALLIGYFEGLDSERGIAWRTADSLSLRRFQGYGLDEQTPDHSTISRTRRLYWLETHKAVSEWVIRILMEEGLIQGQTVSIDASTLEANAAMKSIWRVWQRRPGLRIRRESSWHGWIGSGRREQGAAVACKPSGNIKRKFGVNLIDMRKLVRLNVAPFAGLAMILALVAATPPGSKGLPLRVASVAPCGADDRRILVVQSFVNGQVKLNGEQLRRSGLGSRLVEVLRTRAEKFVFVTAEPDLPFGQVAEIIDIATAHADHVALLPPPSVLWQSGRLICPEIVFRNWQVDAFRGMGAKLPAVQSGS